ncbi:hypothetical protein ACQCVK_12605 [Rossellomorea vietnamensis]|uniref:hypothetical protein n=1 Tax=Rossellomorea vietnamensis TaxID=218284 RepID=UPI003CF25106
MKKACLLLMTVILLAACSPAEDKGEVSQPQEKSEEEQPGDYTFDQFKEDRSLDIEGEDISYAEEENFVGERFAVKGKAQLSRYYNYGYSDLEETHFVVKVFNEEAIPWYLYLSRQEFSDFFQELKKGPVDIYADAVIPEEYYEVEQGHLAMAEEILVRGSEAEWEPLDEELVRYMNDHSIELTARDVVFDKKGMSDQPFALSGIAQIVSYRHIDSEYSDLEPTHFVLELRDDSVKDQQLWNVALDREEYRDLYEQSLKGMVQVSLTAIMPEDRFALRKDFSAIGQDAEFEPLPEEFESPSDSAQAYMKERGVSLTGLDVLYDMSSHAGEPFLVEGTAELRTTLPIGYQDLQDHYFEINIVEDPYGDQPVLYARALEGWSLILHGQKYPQIYERLLNEEQLEVMVIARVVADRYEPGQGGVAFVEDIVVSD